MKRIFFLLSCCVLHAEEPLNLNGMLSDFVLETKQIRIPEHPTAFNPGIVRFNGMYLLSFRILPDPKQTFTSEIGLILLNESFEPLGEPQLLTLRDEDSRVPPRAEDARLIVVNDKLYIVYDDNPEPRISKGGFRVYVAEVYYDGEHFMADKIEALQYFEGESNQRREKSWVPFAYQNSLLLAYSLQPHIIFHPLLDGSGICETIATTIPRINWPWGELRGGTPALQENDHYLAIFHSSIDMTTQQSKGKRATHYFMGAYTFSTHPPFDLTAISANPIVGADFYEGRQYKPYWKPIKCVFPCGYTADEHHLWVVYGRDDYEVWVAKLDKQRLLNSLIPIPPNQF